MPQKENIKLSIPIWGEGIMLAGITLISKSCLEGIGGMVLSPSLYWIGLLGGGLITIYGILHKQDELEAFFAATGLNNDTDKVRVQRKIEKKYGYDLYLTIPKGKSLSDFYNIKEAMENLLDAEIEMFYENHLIKCIVMSGKIPTPCSFPAIRDENGNLKVKDTLAHMASVLQEPYPNALVIPFAYSRLGMETIDLADHHHIMICGETGSGKSVALRTISTVFCVLKPEAEVEVCMVDFKRGVELGLFRNCRNVKRFCTSVGEFGSLMKDLLAEAEHRYELMEKASVNHIDKYNAKHKDKLKKIVVIVDEFSALQKHDDILDDLGVGLAFHRAAGIHYILSSQRPSADILPGTLKANIPTKIGLKTSTAKNSEIIIDEAGLERLPGKGSALLKHSGTRRIQIMYLSENDAEKILRHTYVYKSKKQAYMGGVISIANEKGRTDIDNNGKVSGVVDLANT